MSEQGKGKTGMSDKQTEIGRLARALFDVAPFRDSVEGTYEEQSPQYRALCERYVRAVLEEMMEPTEGMSDAGQEADTHGDAGNANDIWQAMLNHILSEEQE